MVEEGRYFRFFRRYTPSNESDRRTCVNWRRWMKFRKHDGKRRTKPYVRRLWYGGCSPAFRKIEFSCFEWLKKRSRRLSRQQSLTFLYRFLSAFASGIASPFGNKRPTNRTMLPVKYHVSLRRIFCLQAIVGWNFLGTPELLYLHAE